MAKKVKGEIGYSDHLTFKVGKERPIHSKFGKIVARKVAEEAGRPICPKCGKVGSGLYTKWVLNGQGVRYAPYYYFAHPYGNGGSYGLHWHYIKKRRALKIIGDKKLMQKYRITEVREIT